MLMNILRRPSSSDIFDPFGATDWSLPGDPFAEMERLSTEMNRVFRRFGMADGGQQPAVAYPAVDLWQDENFLYVEAELPGMEIGDLEIYVTAGNQLSVRGERKPPTVEGGNWYRQERGYGKFSRLLALPCDVKTEEVEAEFKEGVLTIKLPKGEAAKPRRLAIKAS
jgi:HSP20 family protein